MLGIDTSLGSCVNFKIKKKSLGMVRVMFIKWLVAAAEGLAFTIPSMHEASTKSENKLNLNGKK